MKLRQLYLLSIVMLFSLAGACEKGYHKDIPAPEIQKPEGGGEQTGDEGGGNGGTQKPDDGPHPWDVNRGKEVHPSGDGWTSTVIEDGIIYYTFEGKESVSGQKQRIFVADIDLNNPNYAFKLIYYSSRGSASAVFRNQGAIVSMNGGYEQGSIFIRENGANRSMMPNNTIGDTGVYNWKSEAVVYLDGERGVDIAFDGKDMTVQEQRSYYRSIANQHNSMITSAPMLIDDYEPVGETFYQKYYPAPSDNSEEAYNHQEKNRHPRTVLAKTEFNHLLMIVIDGRRNISVGMKAREVTGFLVKNFNPQYAINMDGGGSSTLCVQGQGDPTTHIVNYPTDSDQVDPRPGNGDHTGERSVSTFFYVVKK